MGTIVLHYCAEFIAVFWAMAPYFLFGLTVAGILHVVIKKEVIARHLQKNSPLSVIKAALFGIPLPLCSCGVVPTALSLRKNNASEGATVAFLISTPQTGVDSIAATYGLLGLTFAIFTPFAALFSGIIGGFVTLVWRPRGGTIVTHGTDFGCTMCSRTDPHRHSFGEKVRTMLSYAYREFLDDISVRLFVGIALSALVALLVPDDFFIRYLENDLVSMLVMIGVGIPLYICATASIPVALALIDKGLSPGAALVFLTVGPATNAATITLIAAAMGKRVVAIYLGVISGMALLNGTILNALYRVTGAPLPCMEHAHHHAAHEASPIPILFAMAFTVLFTASLYRRAAARIKPFIVNRVFAAKRSGSEAAIEQVLAIGGMTCARCVNRVILALRSVKGVTAVEVELATGRAVVRGTADVPALVAAVTAAGYHAEPLSHQKVNDCGP